MEFSDGVASRLIFALIYLGSTINVSSRNLLNFSCSAEVKQGN